MQRTKSASERPFSAEYTLGERLGAGGSATAHVGWAGPADEVVPLRIATAILCAVLRDLDGMPHVHGDVGAHNVVIGGDGFVRLTARGKPKTKLAYAAPEQVLGQTVDRRVDVYAASVLFLEITTGRRPFADVAPNALAAQIAAGMRPRDLRLASELPHDVVGVVMRGLARRPQDRFGTAGEMARALARASDTATPTEVAEWVSRETPISSEMSVVVSSGPPSVNVTVGHRNVTAGNIKVAAGHIRAKRRARTVTTIAMAALGLAFAIAGLVTTGPRRVRPASGRVASACDRLPSSIVACIRERYFDAK